MTSRAFAACLVLLAALQTWAQALEMSLPQLIESLQSGDVRILYSSALVTDSQIVQVKSVDLDALRKALEAYQLELQQQGDVFLVVRAAPADPPPPRQESSTLPLETVIVTGSMHRLPYIGPSQSVYSFSPEDLSLVPTLGSDAMRASLRLPGISSSGVSAKPRIRGGLQDELLVLQDGVELLEPFHLADYHSVYSSIDYHTIESLDVYTGGFPSRYGYRMSGVMDIRNEWHQDHYDTDIGVSSFSNFLHTRGEFGSTRPASWLLSLRRGDLTDLTDYIDTRAGDPIYKDAAARISLDWSEALSLSSGLVYAEDDVLFEDDEESASSEIRTRYGWLGVDWLLNRRTATRLTLSALDFRRRKKQASFELDEEDPGKGGFLDHRQEVDRFAIRNDWSSLGDQTHWEYGWQLEYNRARYRHRAEIDRGDLADILGTEAEVERDIAEEARGWSGGIYAQVDWELSGRLSLQPSLRLDYQDYYIDASGEQQVSPRLGMAYQLSDRSALRLSLGRFHQQEGIQELQVIDGVTRFFRPQVSDQLVGGLHWSDGGTELSLELYYKRYRDQKGRFENIFNPFVLLPEMEPDRVGLWPDKAYARGVDLDLRRSLRERLEGYFRYSFMDTKDRINGEWVDRRWAQRHTINTGIAWKGESYSLSLAVTWHSGWRTSVLPPFVPEGVVIPVETVFNNTELDDYLSIDIGARKHWKLRGARLEIYADIVNVTDHQNSAGIDFDVEEVEGGFALLPDHETLLRRVPSVGVTLSF